MNRGRLALVLTAVTFVIAAWPARATSSPAVSVTLDRSFAHPNLGQTFDFTSTVRNNLDSAQRPLVVHLNVLSLDDSVYVDPEDWSSNRTRYVTAPPGQEIDVHWTLKAVNGGSFIVYVAVLSHEGSGPIAVSQPLHVRVAERRTLNPGGVLPVVVAVPGVLATLAISRWIVRKRREPRRATV